MVGLIGLARGGPGFDPRSLRMGRRRGTGSGVVKPPSPSTASCDPKETKEREKKTLSFPFDYVVRSDGYLVTDSRWREVKLPLARSPDCFSVAVLTSGEELSAVNARVPWVIGGNP